MFLLNIEEYDEYQNFIQEVVVRYKVLYHILEVAGFGLKKLSETSFVLVPEGINNERLFCVTNLFLHGRPLPKTGKTGELVAII